jgi:hypothetical protein
MEPLSIGAVWAVLDRGLSEDESGEAFGPSEVYDPITQRGSQMKKYLLILAVALAVAVPVAAAAGTHQSAAPKPHIIGTWPNNVTGSEAGGYVVWSNGRVEALGHAPFFGSVRERINDIVGFAADRFSGGYWLIGADGAVYPKGSTCVDKTLVGPTNAPKSKVVGAVNMTDDHEGFVMVTAAGRTFKFTCQFAFPS